MNILTRFLSHPLSNKKFDASLPRWVSIPVGAGHFCCRGSNLSATGQQSGQNCVWGLAWHFYRSCSFRYSEPCSVWLEELAAEKALRSIVIGSANTSVTVLSSLIFGGGLWGLSTLPLAKPGFMIGILLLLSVSLALTCLGILSSLMRIGRESA